MCRIAPRSTSAHVRAGGAADGASCGTCSLKEFLEAGLQDVQGQDVHAGYDAHEAFALDDG